MKNLRSVFKHRFGPVAIVFLLVTGISFLTRVVLMIKSWPNLELSVTKFPGIFLVGFFYDCVVACFFSIPVALYCWLMKDSWYQKKWNRVPLFILFFFIVFILVVNAGAEIVFWDEFNVRFNFIAVDYLIYTTEVIGNIMESYNIPLIMTAVVVAVAGLLFLLRKKLYASQSVSMRFLKRSIFFLGFAILTSMAYFLVNNRFKEISGNNYVNELSGNGIYEFGSAFWNNQIEYTKFYTVNDNKKNFAILREMLAQPNATFTSNPLSIERTIRPDSPEHRWNVVMISVESLSGSYLKHFGNPENFTPYLDSLIPHSLFFENFYASGTRTVRGLEALSLAIPPTPGQSIVRRPNNENMFTMGNVLKGKGYDVHYVYGGNSFFDNMGYFFSHSGYDVIDQRDIPKERIHHTTAWGVADEDAFSILLDECDKSFNNQQPFFNHLMTVSNHRPYTFPDGRIDIPSASQSIAGAVKYTDYAINKFLMDAKSKPWFNNTLFVIVSDHCSRSAGKTDLPVNRYHIPCFIYAPALVKPVLEEKFTSQIDLVPTILGLMNLRYQSKFLGYDIYKTPAANQRLFISTYQDMGYVKNDTLVILSPQKKISSFKIDFATGAATKVIGNQRLTDEAIAWYQGASYLFDNNGYKNK
ncbi:MAG: sulfatase [Ferruginibacter sp.]|nr:sulfatase [Ferruginibacter sp.]